MKKIFLSLSLFLLSVVNSNIFASNGQMVADPSFNFEINDEYLTLKLNVLSENIKIISIDKSTRKQIDTSILLDSMSSIDKSGNKLFEISKENIPSGSLLLIQGKNDQYFQKIIDPTDKSSITIDLTLKDNSTNGKSHLDINENGYDSILKNNIFTRAGGDFKGYKDGEAGNEDQILQNFFSGQNGLITIVLRVLGTIGILYLVIAGIRYIFSRGDEENTEAAKNQIIWALVGLVILSLAEFIGFEFINPYEKDILGNDVANTFADKVKQIIRVLEYVVGGLFLINGVVSAYNLITSRGIAENLDSEKTFIQSFIWGAGFILFAEVVIRIVASDISREEQTNIIASEVGGIVNFVLTFFAGAAALMLVIASIYYVSSFGNEEQANKAKALIKNSAIAFVVAFSSYVIAQFIIV